MNKKEPKNCWEFKGCSEENKKDCVAFQNDMGSECWFVSNLTKNDDNKIGCARCFECDWFKKFNENV